MNAAYLRSLALTLVAGLVWSQGGPMLRAQSLADIAKKEEERRKTIPQPAKVYTNKDLTPVPPGAPVPPPPTAPNDAKVSGDATAAGPQKTDAADKDTGDKGEKKDQAYWSRKLKELQQQLEHDQSFADALQVKINALTTDFVNRDDPAQRSRIEQERNKSLAELERLKKAVIDDNKAIADLQEEARRAGVPPGWLR
ncbi:MAG TPA: hypothetical protein VKE51_05020 [Vicinamibacterales bacterium]|nr:hypothetical protein [Vicinamibacterales bacterium]